MATFTPDGPRVRFVDTDGEVSFTATGPSVTFAAAYTSVPTSSGAVDSVNGETGTVVLDAADVDAQRIGTAPVVVANGGTIPAGSVTVLLLGSTATLPSAAAHGLGQQMFVAAIGGTDCVLSATGSDLLAAGAGITIDKDYVTWLGASDISALAFPGALNWGVTATSLDSTDVQALITAGGYVTSATVDLADVVARFSDELLAGITNVFRCNGDGTGRWSTSNLTTEFTTGISYRCLRIPRRPASVPFFCEYITQTHDSGAGLWDNFEGADLWPDDSFGVSVGTPTGPAVIAGKPRDFHEQTEDGGTTDGSGWWPDLMVASDQAVETMTDITFGTGVGRKWLRVPYELDDGGTYHVDADDGAIFRLMSTFTSEKFESIDQHTEDWWLGNNYSGDIVHLIVRDGLDGTLIANPDASTETPGASSFTDGAGNTWTGDLAAEIVELVDPGVVSIDDLSDVATGAAADGDLLRFNGTEWVDYADSNFAAASHTHAGSAITSGTVDIARLPTGTTSTTVALGNDSRFTDARTPTAHKTSHATGGSDALAPSDIGAVPTTRTINGVDLSANRSLSALGLAPPPRLTVSGQYIASTSIASTTSGLTSNRLYYVPVHVPRDLTITRLGVNQVATGSAGASSVGRFGIYENTSDLPAAAFARPSDTIDLTTGTGMKFITGSWALTAGIWWIGFVAQVTSGSPTFGTAPPAIVVPSSDTIGNGTKFEGSVTGTLPATATPGAANTTSPPIVYLYV